MIQRIPRGIIRARVVATASVLLACAACSSPPPYDLVLHGGRVIDGTGAPAVAADVAIRDGRIAAIGTLEGESATERLDVGGLVITPGFIDPHTHGREGIFTVPTADNFIRQGVTTIVEGNDGSSPLPVGPYLDSLAALTMAPNVALFVGHGTVRRAVMGTVDRPATADELAEMQGLVAQAMGQGAVGLSTGLFYVPGSFAPTEEIVTLARVAADSGGIYSSHMRNEDDRVLESVSETIRIGREARLPVHISHHKVGGQRNYGKSEQSLALMQAARTEGIDVTFDQYPYTASHTGISSIVPAWARADDGLARNVANAGTRRRLTSEMKAFVDMRFGNDPSKIQLARCGFDSTLAGKTLADLLAAREIATTPDAIADLILDLVARGGCSAIFHSFDEGDIERLLASPFGMIGSDGALVQFGKDSPHPRAYGTYPRVLGRYVRERQVIPLEEAIRRMTSAPADRLGFAQRGRLVAGAVADLVVFDPATVNDAATFEAPHQYPVGIPHVFVRGVAVVRDGAVTGARPGVVLRRTGPAGGSRGQRDRAVH
jgi:dihydroorotase/N-acyl-D-amino-acid deacylase